MRNRSLGPAVNGPGDGKPVPRVLRLLSSGRRASPDAVKGGTFVKLPRIRPLLLFATATIVVLASGCSDNIIEPELPEPALQYLNGTYLYDEGQCVFIPPGSSDRYPFVCGEVLVGLNSGVLAEDVQDLIDEISGEILTDRSGGDYGSLLVAVPGRTERAAILTVFQDDRTRYGSLNFTGPAALLQFSNEESAPW